MLLAVSCAIVLRSFYLRRQMRRRYEEAIAAGLLPPNAMMPGTKRRDIGEKPKLYDAAVVPVKGEKWDYILVRVLLLFISVRIGVIDRRTPFCCRCCSPSQRKSQKYQGRNP